MIGPTWTYNRADLPAFLQWRPYSLLLLLGLLWPRWSGGTEPNGQAPIPMEVASPSEQGAMPKPIEESLAQPQSTSDTILDPQGALPPSPSQESLDGSPKPNPSGDTSSLGTALLPQSSPQGDQQSLILQQLAQSSWPAGSIQQQLDKDTTLVPYGKGALFIPSMVNPLDEPTISVMLDGQKVAEGKTGTRIALAPGEYQAYFGSGTQKQRFHQQVTIFEDQITVIPITWSGLTVHVMDNRFNGLRAPYELFRMTDLEYIGLGFGSDEQAGEPLATWVIPAGLYKIVRLGQSYRARVDFGTVRLEPGQHTHYLLVQDPNSGSFQGAGEIRIEDIFQPNSKQWGSLILGGNLAFNNRQGGVGFSNGQTYALQGFIDGKINVQIANAPATFRLQLEEGQTRLPSTTWQKNQDRLQLDMLYVYPLSNQIGPYIRARFVSNVLPTYLLFDRNKSVTIEDERQVLLQSLTEQKQLRLSGSLANNEIKEGVGFNLRLLKNTIIETTLRCGFGAIQNIYHNSLQEIEQTNTSARYRRIRSSFPFGPEFTAIALIRVGGWVILNSVVDTLLPLQQQSLTLSIESGATLKLSQFASLNYVFRLNQGPSLLKTAMEHNVFLRLNVELQ